MSFHFHSNNWTMPPWPLTKWGLMKFLDNSSFTSSLACSWKKSLQQNAVIRNVKILNIFTTKIKTNWVTWVTEFDSPQWELDESRRLFLIRTLEKKDFSNIFVFRSFCRDTSRESSKSFQKLYQHFTISCNKCHAINFVFNVSFLIFFTRLLISSLCAW